ncbi:hypothetical protein C6P45_005011 [Maudiozyma exigua]|uniref:Uncharacterized protein n=1 Tax=Maudiozyma exigua TaxID=34358 RepID=A0A9P7BDL4_MAUEX|nr:hypothetical protein C6P45_005011 [Kazachstania exigua]
MGQDGNSGKFVIPFIRHRQLGKRTTTANNNKHTVIATGHTTTTTTIRNKKKKLYNVLKPNEWFITRKPTDTKQWPIRQDFIMWFIMITTSLILLILLVRAMIQLSIEIRPIARYFTIYSIFGQSSSLSNNNIMSKLIKWICSWYIGY